MIASGAGGAGTATAAVEAARSQATSVNLSAAISASRALARAEEVAVRCAEEVVASAVVVRRGGLGTQRMRRWKGKRWWT